MLDETSQRYAAAIRDGDTGTAGRLGALLDTADTLDRQRREHHARIITDALAYAAAGIPVFPIQPGGKRPLTRHGFRDATTDRAQIQAWWLQWPDANLGTPTGDTFDVVDIDGPAGMAAMYHGGHPVIDSLTVLGIALTTRDGGRHIYIPPSGIGNKTDFWPGVDVRSTGGYVVAPPSVGANGRRYEWLATPAFASTVAAA